MRGKGEGETQISCDLRSEGARPKDPNRYVQPRAGNGLYRLSGLSRLEIAHQLNDLARKAFLIPEERAPDGTGSDLIRSRRPSKSQINAPRVKRGEGAELLGDQEGGMVWQHNAASTYPNAGGSGGNVRERHRSRRTRYAWQIVVLGHPVPPVSESLDMACEVERVAQRLTSIAALGDRR